MLVSRVLLIRLTLTELLGKFFIRTKHFDDWIKHSQTHGDFCQDFIDPRLSQMRCCLNACNVHIRNSTSIIRKVKSPTASESDAYFSCSCFTESILSESTMTVIPWAARTNLAFSIIQCIWCSGEVLSAKLPGAWWIAGLKRISADYHIPCNRYNNCREAVYLFRLSTCSKSSRSATM